MQELQISVKAQELHDDIGNQIRLLQKVAGKLGELLDKMRDNKFYKELGYNTFDDYCQTAWGFKRQNAYQLITSSKTLQNVQHVVQNGIELPINNRQLNELAKAPKKDQAKIWEETQKETNKAQPTAKEIKTMVTQTRRKFSPLINKKGEIISHYQLYDLVTGLATKEGIGIRKASKIISKENKILFTICENTASIFKYGKLEIKEEINNLYISTSKVYTKGAKYYNDDNLVPEIESNIKNFKDGKSIVIKSELYNNKIAYNNLKDRLKTVAGRFIIVREYGNTKNPYTDPARNERQNYNAYVKSWLPNNPSKLRHINNLENMVFVDDYDDKKYSIGHHLLTLVKK